MQQLLAAGVEWLWQLQTLFDPLIGWLKEWQLLVGSLIALLAGAITVNAINRQIREQRTEVSEGRLRRVQAARASMPDDLHAICSYARRSAEVGRQAVQVLSANEDGQETLSTKGPHPRLRCPALPTYVPANLKALIENLDDAAADQVADLMKCYYTQRARLAGALENFNQTNPSTIPVSRAVNLNSVFKDTLELYLRANGMLPFARGDTEAIAATFDASEVLSALKLLNLDHVLSPEATEHCLQSLVDADKPHGIRRMRRSRR